MTKNSEAARIYLNAAKNYSWLAENPDAEYGLSYSRLIDVAEYWIRQNPDLYKEIVEIRCDAYTSDRELEGLAMAVLHVKPLPKKVWKNILKYTKEYNLCLEDAVEDAFKEVSNTRTYFQPWFDSDYRNFTPQIYTEEALEKEVDRMYCQPSLFGAEPFAEKNGVGNV